MTTTDTHADLITRLLESYVHDRQGLHVEPAESDDGRKVDWMIEVAPDDQKLAVGAKGRHIKALKFIVREIGLRSGCEYNVILKPQVTDSRRIAPKLTRGYDYTPAQDLLCELLAALLPCANCPAEVSVAVLNSMATPFNPLAYSFAIKASNHDAGLLGRVSSESDGMSLLDAIRWLFLAYGQRDGVTFKMELAK